MGRLQTGRLENFIRRWGSIKGGGSILSETLGDVFPVLDLENLTPENRLPAGWSLVSMFATRTGVAAQLQGISIINPANSGTIGVVTKIVINSETAQVITMGSSLALFTPVVNSVDADTRSSLVSNGALRLGANANTGGAENRILIEVETGIDREFEVPHALAVLAPGTQFAVVGSTVNLDLRVCFFALTRIAEPSELSF